MNIIGRKQEIKELLSLEESGKSELVALYRRRRVGKTYMRILEFLFCYKNIVNMLTEV